MEATAGSASYDQLSWKRGELEISTDPSRIDLSLVHEFLTDSYWAKGLPMDVLERAVRHSLCFGVYDGQRQIGFARAITDRATFAYIADVFITEPYRGRGVSRWLMECVKAHPSLQGLRRWALVTRDAHRLYQQFGFVQLGNPDRWMEIHDPDVYQKTVGQD
jgi:GNAT superfamily N-acetyltransferase